MEVKCVLSLAAANLGREDLVAAIHDCAGEPFGEVASLLRCYNLVENEIALDYFPLKREDRLCICGKFIPLARLRFAPVQILSVKDEQGTPLKFELRPARIFMPHCSEKRVSVFYTYSPREKRFCERTELGGKISSRLLSFGVAAEFLLSNGQFSEAAVWEKRYHDALRAVNTLQKPLRIRSRRWV